MVKIDVTNEWCPHCSNEVELEKVLKVQTCPNCGEIILPCSMCDMDKDPCSNCPLENEMNDKIKIK